MNQSELPPAKEHKKPNNQQLSFVDLFFSFKGRINRARFWLYDIAILNIMFFIPVIFIEAAIGGTDGLILGLGIGFLIMIWPRLALSVKRCHDRNRSGAFVLISLIPIVSIWYAIEVLFFKGTAGHNKYGSDPLDIEEKEKAVKDKSFTRHPLTISIIIIFLLILLSFGVIRIYYDIYLPNHLDRLQLIVEMDLRQFLYHIANNKDTQLEQTLIMTEKQVEDTENDFISLFVQKLEEAKIDPPHYYNLTTDAEKREMRFFLQQKLQAARIRAMDVLHRRLKEFGCIGIKIEEQGTNRIIVELATYGERGTVSQLIGRTALLEFRLLKDPQVIDNIGSSINHYLKDKSEEVTGTIISEVEKKPGDISVTNLEELFGESEEEMDNKQTLFRENLFLSNPNNPNVLLVPKQNEARYKSALLDSGAIQILDKIAGNAELLPGKVEDDFDFIPVYLVNKESELTNETIEDANWQISKYASSTGGYEVSLNFNDEGARIFSRVTGANLQKPLAIVLDGIVQSAPIIQAKIRDGRAVITGLNSMDEARDLAIILRVGALPVPLKIVGEKIIRSKEE
jgi:protein-export membrane protein SecD